MALQTWDIWYPKAAATGLSFARARLDATNVVLVHAAPDVLTVEVRDEAGDRIAFSADLPRQVQTPICRLSLQDGHVVREDIWPDDSDLGATVILPGGEAAILQQWWHADDRKEWRWSIELYNSIR